MSQESGASWKEAWPSTLDTHQLCHLKYDSGTFAYIMLDPDLTNCDLLGVLVLPLGYEVVCELMIQASLTLTN